MRGEGTATEGVKSRFRSVASSKPADRPKQRRFNPVPNPDSGLDILAQLFWSRRYRRRLGLANRPLDHWTWSICWGRGTGAGRPGMRGRFGRGVGRKRLWLWQLRTHTEGQQWSGCSGGWRMGA